MDDCANVVGHCGDGSPPDEAMDSRRTVGDGSGGVEGGHSTDVRPFGVDTVMFDIAIFCRCDGDGGIYSCCPDDFA